MIIYLRKKKMAEDLNIIRGEKTLMYANILPQIKALIEGESDKIANMANVCAALKEQFGWLWVGFYLVKNDELVLGPFQGPVACTRIKKGKGVCGAAWEKSSVLIVPDVDQFQGHIACSSISKSEIVLPFYVQGQIVGVLDVDSKDYNTFDEVDKEYLELVLEILKDNY
jgi:GAF domain-containing protein